MFIHHHPTIWAMMRTQTHRFLDREIGVVRGDVGTPMYGRLCLSCILWGNNTELEVCVWIYIYILYDSLYFSDKFSMWYKHYVFSLFSLCTYTYVYIYICITHDTWTGVASQIPTGNAGSLWLGSKLGCPLVNVYITMERSTIVHGKFHYFDWVIFNSYVTQSLPEATHLTFGWSFPHVIYPLVN